uniref:Uncharacterized protein n=1 Tax=Arion vulgaris TaxID=1028688 RepID=A0A0B7ABY2_9EUPU
MCDEAKPETRTVGVNVNYDTSGIYTSLDFKGETELRLALRDVLHRNVRSVGTNCNFKPSAVECGTVTDQSTGINVGCGDENHRIDVEVKAATIKKSIAIAAKPETGNKCVSTEAGWVLDAGTNTYQPDTYHKSVMTDKLKQMFASTCTEITPSHHAFCQTEYQMMISLEQVKHAASNTEQIQTYSSGMSTDIIPTFSIGVNTTEKMSDIFQESHEQKNVVKTKQLKSILKKSKSVDTAVGDGRIDSVHSDTSRKTQSAFSASKETVVPITQSEYIKKSSIFDDNKNHMSSFEVSTRSAPLTRDFVSSREELLSSSQENLDKRNSAFERVSPTKSEDRFSETVVEHYLITKDGKKLISEEKTTTSSLGTNRSFKQYADNDIDPWSKRSHENEISSSSSRSSHSMSSLSGDDMYSNSSSGNSTSNRINGNMITEKNYASVINNPYMTVENLAEVSSILDYELDNGLGVRHISKTVSQDDLYREHREKKSSQLEKTSSGEVVYNMRRAGSVEDFMPDDIRRYMSIDPSVSKDSGFGEDLIQRFREEQSESPPPSVEVATENNGGMRSIKTSKIITTKRTSTTGDKVLVQETKTVQGQDGQITTVVTETTEDAKTAQEDGTNIDTHHSSLTDQDETDMLTASSASRTHSSHRISGQGGSDSNLSFNITKRQVFPDRGSFTSSSTKSFSETTIQAAGDSDEELIAEIGSYGSLDRKAGKLKSIMKRRSSDSHQISNRKGITFAESVIGGTGSSSQEEDNTSDSDSTTSYEEGSYDGQQGQVIYHCKDDEAIAQGLPGAQMFDQNIRETYELPNEVSNACTVLGTYLVDSTSIQTKQLNACQNLVQQEWFKVSSHKLSVSHQVEDFLSSVNEISKRLLEYIINMTDANGNTAIHYCISHCNFDIASLLLDSEVCDINKQNKAGYTPIMLAGLATLQNLEQREIVRRLFSSGDVNARAVTTQQTALMLAASHGRTEMVKLLVEECADINLQDEDGSTALMCACEHGYLDVVNFLLAQPNINANITDNLITG